jgi:hypothetical protein
MKAANIVILFPLMSVLIVSLYVHVGASRIAALVLLAASVIGVLAGLVWKRARRQDTTKIIERTSR